MLLMRENNNYNLSFYWRWLLALLLSAPVFAFSGNGQSISVRDSVADLTKTEQDTVWAIHHLFQTKRKKSKTASIGVFTLIAGVGVAQVVGSALGAPASGRTSASIVFSLPGLTLLAAGISKKTRFGQTNEQNIVQVYQEQKKLPNFVLRQLNPRYFH